MPVASPLTSFEIRPCSGKKGGSKCGLARIEAERGSMAAHVGGRLTVARVRSAEPGKYPDGANLWLRVGPNGSKSWFFRYTIAGCTREMGLGPWPPVPLSEARDKATAQRRLLLQGA